MINELYLTNFKSHANTSLVLKPLTLLTGLNGSGKSSVIQSLLLLRQSYKKQQSFRTLLLNDSLCHIGTGKDAICQSAIDDTLKFRIDANSLQYIWAFNVLEEKDFLPLTDSADIPQNELQNLSLFTDNFQYLSAGRLPGFKYERNDLTVERERQISLNYGYGELVAQYLYYWGKKENVRPALKNNNSNFDDLINQVTAWEQEISPNVNVVPQKKGDSFTINYSFNRTGSLGSTNEYKTENAAFGLTYALPVITALLSAKKDALLLIENPEAHLHPQGQSKLAELIALTAQNGVQVVVETHSDHIFNGIRKAIAFNKIEKENASVFFFELNDKSNSTAAKIELSDKGRILNHKKGLFDQFDDDLDALLEL